MILSYVCLHLRMSTYEMSVYRHMYALIYMYMYMICACICIRICIYIPELPNRDDGHVPIPKADRLEHIHIARRVHYPGAAPPTC